VGAQPVLPAVALPGVVAHFARLGNRVELPELRAGACVKGAWIADSANRTWWTIRTDDDHVPIDQRNRVVQHDTVDLAVRTILRVVCSGHSVQRNQAAAGRYEDARGERTIAGPKRHAASRRRAAGHDVPPALLSGLRIERNDTICGRYIHRAV